MKCLEIIFYIFILCQVVWGVENEEDANGNANANGNVNVNGVQQQHQKEEAEKEAAAKIPKVNWTPVCVERVQMYDEATEPISEDQIANKPHFIGPVRNEEPAESCDPPNGKGLRNLIKQASDLLPHSKLQAIVVSAMKDPEVQALRSLVTSSSFFAKVRTASESRDFVILRDYICRMLKFDVDFYVEFVRNLIKIETTPSSSPITFQGRSGIRGLLMDLHDALPKQQLRDLYQKLLETDEQLVLAVRSTKAAEFHQLLKNLKNVPEIRQIIVELGELGVPLHEVKELIDIALGWQGDEFGENNFDIKI